MYVSPPAINTFDTVILIYDWPGLCGIPLSWGHILYNISDIYYAGHNGCSCTLSPAAALSGFCSVCFPTSGAHPMTKVLSYQSPLESDEKID